MKTYIGIDIAKLHLDIHRNDKVVRILNNEKSITVFLKSLPEHSIIVCESSGGYEASLISLAHTLHCSIARINARQVRDFAKAKGRLAKSDAIDAQILTEFGQAFHPAPLSVSEPLHQQLAALVKLRSHLLTQITQNNNLTETISDKLILAIIKKPFPASKNRPTTFKKSSPRKSNPRQASNPKSPAFKKSKASARSPHPHSWASCPNSVPFPTRRPLRSPVSLHSITTVANFVANAIFGVGVPRSDPSFTCPHSSLPATTPSSKPFTNDCLPQENQKNSLSPPSCENSLSSPTAS
jgi:transposase